MHIRYRPNVLPEELLQLLLVIGGLVGTTVLLLASGIVVFGVATGSIRAIVHGVLFVLVQLVLFLILGGFLKAQRQIIAEQRRSHVRG
ncbi:hypothetical protein HY635_02855 [Candidatus Uhrbacteria bacterium]|nr:hypothetical protein [Candidatus Uhrbacteria bacterium]